MAQQVAGNLAIQSLLRDGRIQPKLNVSRPGDPDEQEADEIASRVVSSPAVGTLQRKCGCAQGDDCPKCKAETAGQIQAKHRSGRNALVREASDSVAALLRGGGQPLPSSVRAFFEPRFGRDFSGVRIHTGEAAAESAQSLGARAYTYGNDIVFAPDQFAPESQQGRELLAHEMAHTLQQGEVPGIQRYALDPANPSAWGGWFDKESHRKDASFLETVGAAKGAAGTLTKNLEKTEAPKTDAEREAIEQQILTLIRLNAVSMVGAHRAQLAERKRKYEQFAVKPPEEVQKDAAKPSEEMQKDTASGVDPAADTAKAIRSYAQMTIRLNAEKELLQDLINAITSAVRFNAGPETINEEFQTLSAKAQHEASGAIKQRVTDTWSQLHQGGLAWGSKKVILQNLSNDLSAWRKSQIKGVDEGLAKVYDEAPFLADLKATYITTGKEYSKTTAVVAGAGSLLFPLLAPIAAYVGYDAFKKDKPPDDKTLLAEVQAAFQRLLDHTDEAIVKVGSGGIHPLDLPGAILATKAALPPALKPEVDRLQQDHEVFKWATDMVMALGIAVLTGVTGGLAGVGLAAYAAAGGVAAAGVGVAQLGMQAKDMMDRQTLAAASTSPDGTLLGVSAPSTFEWVMLGVGAALTAVDLVMLAREISALKPGFSQEPHPAPGKGEAGAAKAEGEPSAPKPGERPAPGPEGEVKPGEAPKQEGAARAPAPAEQKVIEAGRGDAIPGQAQLDAELAIVERSEPRKLTDGEYVEEVDLGNGHTWRRNEKGTWCRFSNGKICVPGQVEAPGKPPAPHPPLATPEALAKANQEMEALRGRYGPELDAHPDLKAEAARIEAIGDPAVKSTEIDALREKLSDARGLRIEGPRTTSGALDLDAWGARLKAEGVQGDIDDIVRRAKETGHDAIAARAELRAIERARLRGYDVEMLTPPKGPGAQQGVKTAEGKLVRGGEERRIEVKAATAPPAKGTVNKQVDKAYGQIKASGKPGEISLDWTEVDLATSDFKTASDVEGYVKSKMRDDQLRQVGHIEVAWKDSAGRTWITSRTRGPDGKVGPVVTELL